MSKVAQVGQQIALLVAIFISSPIAGLQKRPRWRTRAGSTVDHFP